VKRGDLHIHTSASDGALSPAQVMRAAAEAGMDFIAITDHNSLAGLEAAAALEGLDGVRLIPGVELSAQPEQEEVHLLGYGFDPLCDCIRRSCLRLSAAKRRQVLEIATRLRAEGMRVDMAALCRGAGEGAYVGRPTLARMLVESGCVASSGEAFARYLGSGAPTFVPMPAVDPADCIEAIHQAGGLAVLAHPSVELVDRWLARLAAMGLDGIELYRPGLRGNEQLYVEKAAEHFGLFVTGGSDLHGRRREPPLGSFTVTEEQLSGFFNALAAVDGA